MCAKISRQIYDDPIAQDWQVRLVFMDMLVLADEEGVVHMTAEELAQTTKVPLEVVQKAIGVLARSEPVVGEQEAGQQVLAPISDEHGKGWRVVNFHLYQDPASLRRAYMRKYIRRYRQGILWTGEELRAAGLELDDCKELQGTGQYPYEAFRRRWNEFAEKVGLPKAAVMTDDRRRKFRTRWKEWGEGEAAWAFLERVFKAIEGMPFYRGENDRGWRANVDWLLRKSNTALRLVEEFETGGGGAGKRYKPL